MYFPIDETHPESRASRTSSFSRAPMNGFEIGIKLSDIIGLLNRRNERLEALPLSFFRITSRYHFMACARETQSFLGIFKQRLDLPYSLLLRGACRSRLAGL